jgi:hypothetical protein
MTSKGSLLNSGAAVLLFTKEPAEQDAESTLSE